MHHLPDWIVILMKTWPPLKPSALPVCPVIENSCPKPSGFVNFQLAVNLILTMGDLFSFIIDLEVNTLVAILLGMGWQNSRMVDSIDSLPFFFPEKFAHVHISGRQNKNKLKEKHVESSKQLVNTHQSSHSLYTSFVSVDFGKNMPERCAAFGCTNRRSTTYLQF